MIGASSRTGGQTLQNLHLMTVYTIKKSLMAVLELDGAIKSPKFKELASFKIKRYQMNEEFSVVTDCDGQSMSGLKEDSQAQNIVQILVKIISSYG